ncbi:ANF receptor and/or Lig chan-Glu bd domain containing protein, partial [Asbolus verrucosus]
GIFDENSEDEPIFRWAVDHYNTQLEHYGITFSSITQNISSSDPYETMLTTCSFLSQRAVAIFGPKNEENINNVQSICDYKDIVHVITRWVYQPQHNTVINFYPFADSLSLVYFQLIMAWEWKSFTIFYENNESLLRTSDLLKRAKDAGVQVAVRKLDETGEQVYRESLKHGLNSGEKNFVIDCRLEILETVLTHAQQVGLMTSNYKFFITNLDMHTINLEPFQYNEANISGIKLTKPSDKIAQETAVNIDTLETMTTEQALLVDAVAIITRAIAKTGSFQSIDPKELGCDSQKSLKHGTSLANDVKTSTFYNGLTGVIEFDAERFRSNFDLEILKLTEESGLVKTGTWNLSQGLQLESDANNDTYNDTESLRNKHFIIITCLTDPYGMLKESSNTLTGNDRFEGFGIDLIHELSLMEGFNYTFTIREDKANGKKLANGSWSGMIGDVME